MRVKTVENKNKGSHPSIAPIISSVSAEIIASPMTQADLINRPVSLSNPLTISKIFASPEGFVEFRFCLQRTLDDVPPYKRVVDYMLRTASTGDAEVDVVEVCTVPVANVDDAADDSKLREWCTRLNESIDPTGA